MLRKLEYKDIPFMLEWMHDAKVNCFYRYNFSSMTEEKLFRFIDDSFSETNKHFAFVDDKDEYLGTVSIKNISLENRSAEYAIATRRKVQGTGAAFLATKEVLSYAFDDLNLARVFLNVLEGNIRANKFYIKCGFSYIGKDTEEIVINNILHRLNLYEIRAEDSK